MSFQKFREIIFFPIGRFYYLVKTGYPLLCLYELGIFHIVYTIYDGMSTLADRYPMQVPMSDNQKILAVIARMTTEDELHKLMDWLVANKMPPEYLSTAGRKLFAIQAAGKRT